jgi:hypothetical protein
VRSGPGPACTRAKGHRTQSRHPGEPLERSPSPQQA